MRSLSSFIDRRGLRFAALIVFACACATTSAQRAIAQPRETPPSTQQAGPETEFADAASGVTLSYPSDWRLIRSSKDADAGETIVELQPTTATTKTSPTSASPAPGNEAISERSATLYVAVRPRSDADGNGAIDASNEAFILSHRDGQRGALRDYSVTSARDASVAGQPGVRISGSFTADDKSEMRAQSIVSANEGVIVSASVTSSSAEFYAARTRLARIVETMKFSKPDLAAVKARIEKAIDVRAKAGSSGATQTFGGPQTHFRFSYPAGWAAAQSLPDNAIFSATLNGTPNGNGPNDKPVKLEIRLSDLPPASGHPIERAIQEMKRPTSPVERFDLDERSAARWYDDVKRDDQLYRIHSLMAVEYDHTITLTLSVPAGTKAEKELSETLDMIIKTWRWVD